VNERQDHKTIDHPLRREPSLRRISINEREENRITINEKEEKGVRTNHKTETT